MADVTWKGHSFTSITDKGVQLTLQLFLTRIKMLLRRWLIVMIFRKHQLCSTLTTETILEWYLLSHYASGVCCTRHPHAALYWVSVQEASHDFFAYPDYFSLCDKVCISCTTIISAQGWMPRKRFSVRRRFSWPPTIKLQPRKVHQSSFCFLGMNRQAEVYCR